MWMKIVEMMKRDRKTREITMCIQRALECSKTLSGWKSGKRKTLEASVEKPGVGEKGGKIGNGWKGRENT